MSGYCKVNYELQSLQTHTNTENNVLNVTKTKYLEDCQATRPVYTLDTGERKGYPMLCPKRPPNNFMPGKHEDTADFEESPTTRCPVGLAPVSNMGFQIY